MQNLKEIVEAYYDFRSLTRPDATQALLFLMSEVGEMADAHVSELGKWVRNHDKERSVEEEIGDALMMLTVFASACDVDPVKAMLDKFESKGFKVDS